MNMNTYDELDPLEDFKPVSFLLKEKIETEVTCNLVGLIKEESDIKGFIPYQEIKGFELFDSDYKLDKESRNTISKIDLFKEHLINPSQDFKLDSFLLEKENVIDPSQDLKPDSFLLKKENVIDLSPQDLKLGSFLLKKENVIDPSPQDLKLDSFLLKKENGGIGNSSTSDFVTKEEPDIKGPFRTPNNMRKSSTDCFVLLRKITEKDCEKFNIIPKKGLIVNPNKTKSITSSNHSETDEIDDADGTPDESNHDNPRTTGIEPVGEEDKIRELEKLMEEHKGKRICKLCHKSKPTKRHFLFHLKILPFACTICDKRFTQKHNLQTHILREHSTARSERKSSSHSETDESDGADGVLGQSNESNCSNKRTTRIEEVGENEKKVIEELLNDHLGKQFCKLCHKSAPTRRHFMSHLNIKPFVCMICGKRCSQKTHLQIHIDEVHSAEKRFSCPTCNKTFKTKHSLRYHAKVHQPILFKCLDCNTNFKSKVALSMHMRIHNNFRPYTCSVCNKSFTQSGNMKNHERLHFDDRPFSCTLCPMKFKIKKDVSRHMLKHSDTFSLSCDQCGQKFKYKNIYNDHMVLHKNPKAFTCGTCGKKYTSSGGLRNHMLGHKHDPNTYVCDLCDKVFPNVNAVRSHKRYVHSTKTYKCDCGAKFHHRLYLLQHMRTHSTRVPLSCEFCSKTFYSKVNFMNHKEKHH